MCTLAANAEAERRQAIELIARMIRLQRQVDRMNRQLDAVERDMRTAIDGLGHQRPQEYC